jgi:hypothetical protein
MDNISYNHTGSLNDTKWFKTRIKDNNFESKILFIDSLNPIALSKPQNLKPIMPDIIKMLDDKDWRVRKNVLDLIGNIGFVCYDMVKEHVEKIMRMLEDYNPNVVCSAAYSLAKITLNPECLNKSQIISNLTKKITNKYILTEIFKNISEIQPNIVKECLNDILQLLDDSSNIIKINILKILGNIEDIDIDEKTAKKIEVCLSSKSELKKYASYTIWKLSKKHPQYFKSSINNLVRNLNLKDDDIKIYSLLALSKLCYLEPQKFENLEITELLFNSNEKVRTSLLQLLYSLSLINSPLLVKNMDKIYYLLNEKEYSPETIKLAIKIIGNMALYNQKYINACLDSLNNLINNPKLRQYSVIALIKGKYITKKVLIAIFKAVETEDTEFLREIIEYYPPELLDELKSEIKKLKPVQNRYNQQILKLIDEKKEGSITNYSNMLDSDNLDNSDQSNNPKDLNSSTNLNSNHPNPNIEVKFATLEGYDGLPVIIALKSECSEVELEDGRKTYILPKDCCIETSLTNSLLEVLEIDSKNEIDAYKLAHEIMIKSLIEDVLWDSKNNKK